MNPAMTPGEREAFRNEPTPRGHGANNPLALAAGALYVAGERDPLDTFNHDDVAFLREVAHQLLREWGDWRDEEAADLNNLANRIESLLPPKVEESP